MFQARCTFPAYGMALASPGSVLMIPECMFGCLSIMFYVSIDDCQFAILFYSLVILIC